MSDAVLEFNDQSLLIQADGGALVAEPGFARLTDEGVVTGGEAHARAWLEPQHTHDHYWSQLGVAPLPAPHRWARHHADIAFAQLRSMWDEAGSPRRLLLLVPGSFSDEQVSLLLGMAEALPARVRGVVDSAIAACWRETRDTLFVDMQLHQTVATRCAVSGGRVSVADQETLSDLGMMQLGNTLARHVSNLLIDSHRYDPLYTSEHEQEIFDEIPGWLAHLRWESELAATLDTPQGALPFVLRREDVTRLVEERLVNLRAFARRHRDARIVLSRVSAVLAGLAPRFAEAAVAGQTVCMDNGFALLPMLPDASEGVVRLRALDTGRPAPAEAVPRATATHLLCGARALPLGSPVSVRVENGAARLSAGIDRNAALSLVVHDGVLEAVHQAPEADAVLPDSCAAGGEVLLGEHRLQLIEVGDG